VYNTYAQNGAEKYIEIILGTDSIFNRLLKCKIQYKGSGKSKVFVLIALVRDLNHPHLSQD